MLRAEAEGEAETRERQKLEAEGEAEARSMQRQRTCTSGLNRLRLVNPPEVTRKYSSVDPDSSSAGRDGSTGEPSSVLGAQKAWKAAHNSQLEWVELDCGTDMLLAGFVVQSGGRMGMVKAARVSVSRDGETWEELGIYKIMHRFRGDGRQVSATSFFLNARCYCCN